MVTAWGEVAFERTMCSPVRRRMLLNGTTVSPAAERTIGAGLGRLRGPGGAAGGSSGAPSGGGAGGRAGGGGGGGRTRGGGRWLPPSGGARQDKKRSHDQHDRYSLVKRH